MTIKTIYIPAGGGFDNVTVENSQPADPAPGEITVRLRASSLNFHDYMVVKGITGADGAAHPDVGRRWRGHRRG